MLRNRILPIAVNTSTAIALAPENGSAAEEADLSSGWRRSSYRIRVVAAASETANRPSVVADNQRCWDPR